jgi:exosortase/archaeosortase family protein
MDHKRNFMVYALKFAILFCIAYFGTLGIIGLSTQGGSYSSFVHNYLDYVTWLRHSLLYAPQWLLSLLGYHTYIIDNFTLRAINGSGVRIEYDCVGYGVMSFWLAFIVANKGTLIKKIGWILSGWFLIWCINVVRISMVLVTANKHWKFPLGLDHHTWFNIAAYILVFIMIYFYDRSSKEKIKNQSKLFSNTESRPQKIVNDHNRY